MMNEKLTWSKSKVYPTFQAMKKASRIKKTKALAAVGTIAGTAYAASRALKKRREEKKKKNE